MEGLRIVQTFTVKRTFVFGRGGKGKRVGGGEGG